MRNRKFYGSLGNALLYGCTGIGAAGLIEFDDLQKIYNGHEMKIIIGILFLCGLVGKFLSDYFKEDNNSNTKENTKP